MLRREDKGSDNNNETRFVQNLTNRPITLGDIDLELLPGKPLDLCRYISVQKIGSSTDLKSAVQAGWIRFRNRDNRVVARASVSTAIIPAVLDDADHTTEAGDIIANELIRNIKTVTSNYPVIPHDDVILVDAPLAAIVTLPSAIGLLGYNFVIKNMGTTSVTIVDASEETIDGSSSQVISQQYNSLTLVSNNTNWMVI